MALDPFITTEDLSNFIGRDVTSDPGALIAIDAACQTVRDYARQSLDLITDEVVLDGSGTDCLILPEVPVGGVVSVEIDGGAVDDWVLGKEGRLLRTTETFIGTWPLGRQNVAVTYTHGWLEIPSSVRGVALALATRLNEQGPAISKAVGTDSVTYAGASTELLPTEKMVLRLNAAR